MSDKPDARNKGGRPSKDPAGGKRPTITFRCRSALQEKLQTSAQAADRSVSEEIERRIEESFQAVDIIKAASEGAAKGASVSTIKIVESIFGGPEYINTAHEFCYALKQALHTFGADVNDFRSNPEITIKALEFCLKRLPLVMEASKHGSGTGGFYEKVILSNIISE